MLLMFFPVFCNQYKSAIVATMGRKGKGIACFSSVKKAFSTPQSKEKKNQVFVFLICSICWYTCVFFTDLLTYSSTISEMEKVVSKTDILKAQVQFRSVQHSSKSCSATADSYHWNCSAHYSLSRCWKIKGGSGSYQDSDSIPRIHGIHDEIFFLSLIISYI